MYFHSNFFVGERLRGLLRGGYRSIWSWVSYCWVRAGYLHVRPGLNRKYNHPNNALDTPIVQGSMMYKGVGRSVTDFVSTLYLMQTRNSDMFKAMASQRYRPGTYLNWRFGVFHVSMSWYASINIKAANWAQNASLTAGKECVGGTLNTLIKKKLHIKCIWKNVKTITVTPYLL